MSHRLHVSTTADFLYCLSVIHFLTLHFFSFTLTALLSFSCFVIIILFLHMHAIGLHAVSPRTGLTVIGSTHNPMHAVRLSFHLYALVLFSHAYSLPHHSSSLPVLAWWSFQTHTAYMFFLCVCDVSFPSASVFLCLCLTPSLAWLVHHSHHSLYNPHQRHLCSLHWWKWTGTTPECTPLCCSLGTSLTHPAFSVTCALLQLTTTSACFILLLVPCFLDELLPWHMIWFIFVFLLFSECYSSIFF